MKIVFIILFTFALALNETHAQNFRTSREVSQNIFGRLARRIQQMMDGHRSIVAENFSDENLQKKSDPKLAAEGKLRDVDWRLPYLTKIVPGRQKYRNQTLIEVHPQIWKAFMTVFSHYDNNKKVQELARHYQKVQDEVPAYTPFPCSVENGRSSIRPSSVDYLRPGDIDLVAAIGDSLIAGTSLAGVHAIHVTYQNSGMSWAIGGLGNWRKYLTLPNILKEFNPNLIGYAAADTLWNGLYEATNYNLAVPSAIDDDLLTMAKTFVTKLKGDTRVNFKEDWKLITVFHGGNNLCSDFCYWKRPSDAIVHHKKVTEEALDYLMENSPRTIVNFVILPNFMRVLAGLSDKSNYCMNVHHWMCSCIFGDIFDKNLHKYLELTNGIIKAQRDAANNPKYQGKADFAVLEQPVLVNVSDVDRDTKYGRSTDYRLLSSDCVHFSQRLAAIITNALWNSLLSAYGSKPNIVNRTLFETFECPSRKRPYIATHRNSVLNIP